jgi:branched-chain amino acid transport system permease protein
VRLSGIYLAMLTLAFAQIAYAVVFQMNNITGGDNGLVGIWPAFWARDRTSFYYLVLVLTTGLMIVLRHLFYAPFGYALRSARDSRLKADAIGLDVFKLQWLGFVLAGAATGVAGGLYAFSKGSIDPTLLGISLSVDFLTMVLLGGLDSVMGAIVGAASLHFLKDWLMPLTDHWRALLGISILALVLGFRRGLVGAFAR